MIWNRELECLSRADLGRLQAERLRATVERAAHRVNFYRDAFGRKGIGPSEIRSAEDVAKLPFTRKTDFRDTYPFGLFAVPREEVVRIHASSGTTGKPTVVGYTRADIEVWAEVCARSLAAAGARPGDAFQNAYGYGLFTGGLGMHYGGERMGLAVIPVSGGNTERQLLLIRDLRPRIVACTPSYALVLGDALRASGSSEHSVESFVLGAEPWTEEMRGRIEELWGADAVNIYGLSEVIGPGVSCECVEAKHGSHVFEDHFLAEIVRPGDETPLPHGEVGELVLTTLTKQAVPVIRYRTGDLCSLDPEPCACGRTHVRMSRVVGRVDDMIIIRGINVFPSQVESALVAFAELSAHYQLVVEREGHLDALTVRSEVTEAFAGRLGPAALEAGGGEVEGLVRRIGERLTAVTTLHSIEVRLVSPGELPRSEGGKLRRVVDRRKL